MVSSSHVINTFADLTYDMMNSVNAGHGALVEQGHMRRLPGEQHSHHPGKPARAWCRQDMQSQAVPSVTDLPMLPPSGVGIMQSESPADSWAA